VTWFLVILFASMVLIGLLLMFLFWVFHAPGEDDQVEARRSASLFSRMRNWFTRSTPKLSYRRDKSGRFRKIWRG